jgi:hypothetical protein
VIRHVERSGPLSASSDEVLSGKENNQGHSKRRKRRIKIASIDSVCISPLSYQEKKTIVSPESLLFPHPSVPRVLAKGYPKGTQNSMSEVYKCISSISAQARLPILASKHPSSPTADYKL